MPGTVVTADVVDVAEAVDAATAWPAPRPANEAAAKAVNAAKAMSRDRREKKG
ncbi:hypothetical protein JCM10599A_38040 [Paraburkholderia kururiensis]